MFTYHQPVQLKRRGADAPVWIDAVFLSYNDVGTHALAQTPDERLHWVTLNRIRPA